MKLLNTEIDIVPGRKPQKQPVPEGWIGPGTGVVRLTNTTSQENSYTVRLVCDNPYWQDQWYSWHRCRRPTHRARRLRESRT